VAALRGRKPLAPGATAALALPVRHEYLLGIKRFGFNLDACQNKYPVRQIDEGSTSGGGIILTDGWDMTEAERLQHLRSLIDDSLITARQGGPSLTVYLLSMAQLETSRAIDALSSCSNAIIVPQKHQLRPKGSC
jgi:hypothetical protein